MNKEIMNNERTMSFKGNVLRALGIGVLVATGIGCDRGGNAKVEPSVTSAPTSTPDTTKAMVDARTLDLLNQIDKRLAGLEVNNPTGIVTATVAATVVPNAAAKSDAQEAAVAKATEALTTTVSVKGIATLGSNEVAKPSIEREGVKITGVPDRIGSGNIVDVAKGPFKNTLGMGTEAFIAEPGGLLVGSDFGSKSAKNPFGENPAGWDAMYDSGGSIKPFSPVSQEVLRYGGPAFQNLPEGGFVFASAGQMTAKIGETNVDLKGEPGKNYFFIVRGLYPDGKQDSDLNRTIEFTNYKPGHALVDMYESRDKTNTAFISEGQFLQMAGTSHTGGTNCGAEGCSKLTAVFFDVNTKAVTIIEQTQDRFGNPAAGWKEVFRNWGAK